jgi:hypothetical protein
MSLFLDRLLAQMGPVVNDLVDLDQWILTRRDVRLTIGWPDLPLLRRIRHISRGAGELVGLVGCIDLAHRVRS